MKKETTARSVRFVEDRALAWPGFISRSTRQVLLPKGALVFQEIDPDVARRAGRVEATFWSTHPLPLDGEVLVSTESGLLSVAASAVEDVTKTLPYPKLQALFTSVLRSWAEQYANRPVSVSDFAHTRHLTLLRHLLLEIKRRKGEAHGDKMWWNCGTNETLAEAANEGKLLPAEERRRLCGP